ncbi:hypothetical protein ABS767_15235 [Sphingomonas sp. ST-64]|uniref:Uncharacterized protein n=1 Tax=Sphingomonas plantiphila TaxID=3163295 RepID=A0ABW8YPW7_9SPHN
MMRGAAVILFALAILTVIASLILVLSRPHAFSVLPGLGGFLAQVATALTSATLPFFGAALLWRIDRYLDLSKGGKSA